MTRDLHQPHDRLFRKVFSEPAEAAGLLRAYVPAWLAGTLDWSRIRRRCGSSSRRCGGKCQDQEGT